MNLMGMQQNQKSTDWSDILDKSIGMREKSNYDVFNNIYVNSIKLNLYNQN